MCKMGVCKERAMQVSEVRKVSKRWTQAINTFTQKTDGGK